MCRGRTSLSPGVKGEGVKLSPSPQRAEGVRPRTLNIGVRHQALRRRRSPIPTALDNGQRHVCYVRLALDPPLAVAFLFRRRQS
jgi:hypothetical protein